MPLITTQQFPGLAPTSAQDIIGGLQAGQQFQARRGALQQQAKEQQIRQTLGQIGQQQPLTEQQQMLQAQGAELGEVQQQVIPEEQLIQQARQIDPVIAEQTLKQLGLDRPSRRAEASRFASQALSLPPDQRQSAIQQRAQTLAAEGRDPSDTLELLDLDPASQERALKSVQLLDLSTQERIGFDFKANDQRLKQQQNELKALEAEQKRETNRLKQQELQQKIADKKLKQQSLIQEKTKQGQNELISIGDTINTIDRLTKHPGLKDLVGIQGPFTGPLYQAPGSDAAAAKSVLDTLQSQTFLSQIEKMTGMGALSENEGKKLASSIGSLSTSMPEDKFIEELDRIKKVLVRNGTTLTDFLRKDPNIDFGQISIPETLTLKKPPTQPDKKQTAQPAMQPGQEITLPSGIKVKRIE